ncbi:hypothetical protein LTR24_004700 [Lithohypha guttulata]|uniref:Major facilitator superfamily (MFS) profile domain-containing protein n=1 Tax=Lithohypha guttulata TaxID=1690604 RepID=A0ABR0KBD9_9EURO|nr:hypothetical protein LTR24_004700 [Lithohypha guttulata]
MTTTTTTIAQLEETGPSSYSRHGSDISTHVLHRLPTTNVNDTEEPPADAFEAIPDGGIDSWITVSACGFLTFWSNGYISSWGVLQAAILQSSYMEVNIWTLSFVGSLALACIVAFGTLSVRAMKLFGMRYTCLVAVLLLGLGPILTSFTLNHLGGLFCTAGALVGVTSSILYTASNSLPVQWFSSKLATGVPSALLLKERRRTISTARIDWLMLKKVPFLYLCLAGAASTFALYVPPFFIPLFARSMGLSPSTGAGLVAGFGLSTTFGRMLSGVVCDKLGPLNTLALTMLVNTVSMLAIWPVSSSLAPLVLFAIINGAGNGSFFVAMPTAIAALSGPGLASGAMSIGTSFWTLGDLLGTPIAGILIASTGAATSSTIEPYRAAIFYAGGVSLVGLVLVVTSRFSVNTKVLKRL